MRSSDAFRHFALQEQENQQQSRWRERDYGNRDEERNRDWEEQSGQRGLSGYSRGSESEQSGWRRDIDEDRWGQGGYGQSQYAQREFRESGRSPAARWRPEESSRERQQYGRQYESQSFDQPYPPGFQSDFGSSQRSRSGFGREGYAESGEHRGKGPKGYTRSDDRLKEVICEKLTDDPMIDASEITIEVTGQIVKLTGTVDDRSAKYEVEELVERCGGVKDIDNQLRVRSGSSQNQTTGSGTAQTTSQSAREGSTGSSGTKRSNS